MAEGTSARSWDEQSSDASLIDRAEVVRLAGAAGAFLTINTLRGWENRGLLPKPRVCGRPTKALYPRSAVPVIAAFAANQSGPALPEPSPALATALARDALVVDGDLSVFAELTYRDAAGRSCGRRVIDVRR